MNDSKQDRTVSYATFQDTMLPVKQAVLDGVNDYEEHRDAPESERSNMHSNSADGLKCSRRSFLEISPSGLGTN